MDPQANSSDLNGSDLNNSELNNADLNSPDFEKTITGDDFDFDFDEDFESESTSEYIVMDAMRFDREAGTARCNFKIDEDEQDGFGSPIAKSSQQVNVVPQPAEEKDDANAEQDTNTKAAAKPAKGKGKVKK